MEDTRQPATVKQITFRHCLNVPCFFVLCASLLQVVYLMGFSPLWNYGHSAQRFSYVMHLAYSALGESDTLPVSLIDLFRASVPKNVREISSLKCTDWMPSDRLEYCKRAHPLQQMPQLSELIQIPLNPEIRFPYVPHVWAAQFPIISYFGYILGALAGILLQLPPVIILYLSVIGNAICIIILGYFSLRLLPILRWPMCFILLLPQVCLLRVFIMPDALVLDLIVLLFATILHLAFHPMPLSSKRQWGLVMQGIVTSLIKVCYVPVTLVLWLIPSRCFPGSIRKYWLVSSTILLSFLASVLWGIYITKVYAPKIIEGTKVRLVDTDHLFAKLQFIIEQPVMYLQAVFTQFDSAPIDKVLTSESSDQFPLFLPLSAFILSSIFRPRTPNPPIGWMARLLAVVAFFTGIVALYTSRYLIINQPFEWHVTHGFSVLGRYFLPLLPIVPISCWGWVALSPRWEKIVSCAATALLLGCLSYLHYFQLLLYNVHIH